MAIGMYQTESILPYSNQSDQYHWEADYVGRLNNLNDALAGMPLGPVVTKVNEAKRQGAEVNDVKGPVTYYVFNGHSLGLRFFLLNGRIGRVTYAFRSQKGEEPQALTTNEVLTNPCIKGILKENSQSLDSLVTILLKK